MSALTGGQIEQPFGDEQLQEAMRRFMPAMSLRLELNEDNLERLVAGVLW